MAKMTQVKFKIPPYPHQKLGLERALKRGRFVFGFDTGTGKTATAIHIIRLLFARARRVLPTLIIVPDSMVLSWKAEFEKHAGKDTLVHVHTLGGKGLEKAQLLNTVRDGIFIVNYGAFTSKKFWEITKKLTFDIVIIDESHWCKTTAAARTKKITGLCDKAKYIFCLTGTFTPKDLLDVYSQTRLLSPAIWGCNFSEWRDQWFRDVLARTEANFPKWEPRPGAEKRILSHIKPYCMFVRKEEVIELPPFVQQTIPVELTPALARHYRDLKQEFMTILAEAGDKVVTDTVLAQMIRLHQCCSGLLRGEKEDYLLPCNKLATVQTLLGGIRDAQTIVWTNFRFPIPEILRICKELKLSVSTLVGGMKDQERQDVVDAFQDGKFRVLIATQKAAGVGLTLTAAAYSIYYSKDWSLEDDLQSQARNYRIGSTRHSKITRYDLETVGTLEVQIAKALKEKLKLHDLVMNMKG